MVTEIAEAVRYFLSLGPALMMPVILFILAMVFRQPVGKSARAAILVGIAFVGIFAVLGAVLQVVSDIVKSLVETYRIRLIGLDIGWPLTAAITWAIPISATIIPLGFIVNIVLLIPGWTSTFDADVWNYWHWAFTAVMVYMWTNDIILSYIVAIITEIIILKLADWTAPLAQKFFGIPGCSLPHTETTNWAPLNLALEKLIFSRIRSLERIRADPESLRERFGVFGEPMMIGFLIGILLGLIARMPWDGVLKAGIYVAALMLLMGRMIGILMEGLVPIADGIREYFERSKRFKGRTIWIGIDAGPIGNANPPSIAVGYISIPILYFMATALSWVGLNQILPLADVAIIPLFFMWAAAASRGNLVKALLNGLITLTLLVVLTSMFAAPLTQAAIAVKYSIPVSLVSSLDAGSHVLPFAIMYPIISLKSGDVGGFAFGTALLIIYFTAWYYARDMPKKLAEAL
ncbi:MAG: PTS transporter subunit IIC [Desulfurococcaceae archaeon]